MKSKWMVYGKKADFKAIGEKHKIDQVVARVIRNRDVVGDDAIDMYLNGTLEDCHDPHLLKDADKCVDILMNKISMGKKLRIIGDYDIDGICSIFILYKGLKRAGADVDYVVPHRITDGYGINEKLINAAMADEIDTIITCDNGIAAVNQVKYAKENGMTVIITDHHDIPFELENEGNKIYSIPEADAVVDPKQNDCSYPFDKICGAAVAYKIVQIIYERINADKSELGELADAMAIATVGDVVDLTDENRIFVKYGLNNLKNTKNKGIKALAQVCNIELDGISAYHIGFILGPCLNASGRLDTAKRAIEMLLCNDTDKALELAMELKTLNDERKNLTENEADKAYKLVETTALKNDRVLVVYLPDCHESIAGIIAGRIRERFYKPSIVITDAEEGAKGSGRSIEGYNMFEEISACKELLTKFGGHPMAAGLSLKRENIDSFRKALNDRNHLTDEQLTPVTHIDVPMPVDYVSIGLVEQLRLLEPFGKGNEKPVFADRNLFVKNASLIGKNKNVLKCNLENENGRIIEGIMFNADEENVPAAGTTISVVYYPDINTFNGSTNLQFRILEWRYQS
ncbi:MAG: single-stranded-DNA-specific exonuclease RecJ [Lachnospira sp.]